MMWTILILNFLVTNSPGHNVDVAGTYELSRKGANSTSWSTTILELNCDSTVSVDRKTHGGQIKWEGFWKVRNDTLIVNIKPLTTEDGRKYSGSWENVNQFLVEKKSLIPVVTQLTDEELKDEDLLKDMNRRLKKERYRKIKEKSCT